MPLPAVSPAVPIKEADRAGLAMVGRTVVDDGAVLRHAAQEGDRGRGGLGEGAQVQHAAETVSAVPSGTADWTPSSSVPPLTVAPRL